MINERLAEEFKASFRHHPSSVALITATTPSGPVGLTVSSVSSTAIDPPSLSFSVITAGRSASAILVASSFSVQMLRAESRELARDFARTAGPRFTAEQGWDRFATNEPLLPSALAALRCQPLAAVPVGSSTVVIAEVLEVHFGEPGNPLLYSDRGYHGLGELLS